MIFWLGRGGGGGSRGGATEDLPLDEFFMGEEKFHEEGAGFSSTIKKKTMKK